MSWQLWVAIAVVAAGLILLAAARMRHARRVFDDITDLGHPAAARTSRTRASRPAAPAADPADELAKARARQFRAEPYRHHGHG
ncbi:hypothetical protein [Kribbella solani]|uniref:Uncharacterized protein n=1 Tax=Kribbella solani TaxID=236067 RepID=A0A841E187_9ACTN|nr:hypothetical protein [Kribbella solani]MBB5982765.1 hypothetical protein [Kribbella solani]